jgi:hypothetical protein
MERGSPPSGTDKGRQQEGLSGGTRRELGMGWNGAPTAVHRREAADGDGRDLGKVEKGDRVREMARNDGKRRSKSGGGSRTHL